jgi:kynureninase
MNYRADLDFAREMDAQDPLREYRNRFFIPVINGKETIYFTGNSLGLQPKSTRTFIEEELKAWEEWGVEGHFHAKRPWFKYHHFLTPGAARLVGANESEVVVMNSLTVNLNLLMVSFYNPQGKRNKILIEGGAFPSDHYAVQQQIRFHGLDPAECMLELHPRQGEKILRTEDILSFIDDHGDELALIMLGGVNYYTGQFFDLEAITHKGHQVGAVVGFDLAHAAGNLPLKLHEWGPDFATWCTYKYLNSGPGGTSGVFVHERHGNNPDLPRFAGWWGNDEDTRFQMKHEFHPAKGAAGWQQSNAQVLSMAAHLASLEIFDEVGMAALREKSLLLTGYLEWLIKQSGDLGFEIITPEDPAQRGCQLSLLTGDNGKELFDRLTKEGVIADWREPNVIRVAPVPLYNTFEDVYRFVEILNRG